jgi:hypothetical protein
MTSGTSSDSTADEAIKSCQPWQDVLDRGKTHDWQGHCIKSKNIQLHATAQDEVNRCGDRLFPGLQQPVLTMAYEGLAVIQIL